MSKFLYYYKLEGEIQKVDPPQDWCPRRDTGHEPLLLKVASDGIPNQLMLCYAHRVPAHARDQEAVSAGRMSAHRYEPLFEISLCKHCGLLYWEAGTSDEVPT